MKERYENLDGLRTIACLSIIAIHIIANAEYHLHPVLTMIVKSWAYETALFIMISGFGMFCGYYEKFKSNSISLNDFYAKRYKKLLPFFVTLIMIDIVLDRSLAHVIEGITDATLAFGLLPNNNLSVIGVAWTIGVIFLFYMLFPFFVFLFWTKARAWISFAISVLISIFCAQYFFKDMYLIEGFSPRHSFLYAAPWIMGGCLVYMNRKAIVNFVQRFRWICFAVCVAMTVLWYFVPETNYAVEMLKGLVLFLFWLMYAIGVKSVVLSNKVMKYFSGVSLEFYLAHMVIFRVLEKMHCLYLLGNGWVGFVFTWIAIVIGLIVFTEVWRYLWKLITKVISDKFTVKSH